MKEYIDITVVNSEILCAVLFPTNGSLQKCGRAWFILYQIAQAPAVFCLFAKDWLT